MSFLGDVVKYFGSEWSFGHFHISEPHVIAGFGTGNDKNTILALCGDGSMYKYKFSPDTGDMRREAYHKFLQKNDEEQT